MIVVDTLQYIINAPFFFETVGFITASSMFIGATLYNGDLKLFAKGLITLLPYAGLLLLTNAIRIANYPINNHVQAYAGLATIVVVTVAYVSGLFMGVELVRYALKKK